MQNVGRLVHREWRLLFVSRACQCPTVILFPYERVFHEGCSGAAGESMVAVFGNEVLQT